MIRKYLSIHDRQDTRTLVGIWALEDNEISNKCNRNEIKSNKANYLQIEKTLIKETLTLYR